MLADLQAGKNSGFVGGLAAAADDRRACSRLRPRTTGRQGSALVILSVDAGGSPADKKKFEFGDTIYEIDGTPVRKFQDAPRRHPQLQELRRHDPRRGLPLPAALALRRRAELAAVRRSSAAAWHFKRTIKLR